MCETLYGTRDPYGNDRLDACDLERLSSGMFASDVQPSQLKLVGDSEYIFAEVQAKINIRIDPPVPQAQYDLKTVLWVIPMSFVHGTNLFAIPRLPFTGDIVHVGDMRIRDMKFVGGIVTANLQNYMIRHLGYTREYSAVIATSPISKELSLLFLKYGTINIIYKTDDIRYGRSDDQLNSR